MPDAGRDFSMSNLLALVWPTVAVEPAVLWPRLRALTMVVYIFHLQTMGGDLSGKAQNASKGIYAMACK
jgi:hypothetical protein